MAARIGWSARQTSPRVCKSAAWPTSCRVLTGATNQSVAAPLGIPSEEFFGELVSELGKVDTSTRQRFMVLRNNVSPSGAHKLYVY